MTTIPQRDLRNRSGEILRRAEAGESFTVTVGGRPVAELVPLSRPARLAAPRRLAELLADTPVDDAWAAELAAMRAQDSDVAVDPWS